MAKTKTSSKFWDSRLVWVILSILASVLLWVYVTMTEGDLVSQTFNGVRVEFAGQAALRDEKGFIITDISSTTVSVTLRGTRNELSRLSSDSMKAVIDVSKIPYVGTNTAIPSVSFTVGTNTTTISANNMTISPAAVTYSVVKEMAKTIDVKGVFNGTIAEGYYSDGSPTFDPVSVIIRGPDSEVKRVEYAWVEINRENLDTGLSYESTYKLVDKDLNEIPAGNIELDRETVNVTLRVNATKEVPLTVNVVEGAGASAENTQISCVPSTIVISGDKEILDTIDKISVGTVDLSSFASTFEETFTFAVPDGASNLTGTNEARVTVQIIGLETRTFTIDNISVANLTNGYAADILTESVEVIIRGPAEALSKLENAGIRIIADATDIGTGTGEFEAKAKIVIDGATGVGAIGAYTVHIRIRAA